MNFFELIALVVENLSRRKGRVALTAVGVVIGTAAIVILVSLGMGLQRNATEQLWGIGDLTQIQVMPDYSIGMAVEGGMMVAGEMPTPEPITDETLAQFAALPGVQAVIPRDYLQGGAVLTVGRQEIWANLVGIGTRDLADLGLTAEQGVLELERGTMIVGAMVPQNAYDPNMRPGDLPPEPPDLMNSQVKLSIIKWTEEGEVRKNVPVRVVGLTAETRSEYDWTVFMPIEDVQFYNEWMMGRRINRSIDGYQNVTVRAESPREVTAITDAIINMGYAAYAPQEMVEGINNYFTVLQVIFGGVGAIALIVAAIGIANTMAMAVLERTREIGLMKAIGATNRDVVSIFLGEAAGIGMVGGIGGALVGWLSGQVLNVVALAALSAQAAETGAPPPSFAVVTPFWLPLFAIVFSILVGLLSGLYPALRAATLIPVVALKYE